MAYAATRLIFTFHVNFSMGVLIVILRRLRCNYFLIADVIVPIFVPVYLSENINLIHFEWSTSHVHTCLFIVTRYICISCLLIKFGPAATVAAKALDALIFAIF